MAIKTVIFDCFGVLIISGRPLLLRDYPDKKDQIYDLQVRSDYGMISRQEYSELVADIVGLSAAEVEQKYWNINQRNENVIDWIKSLKKHGNYKIALLSNIGPGWIDDFISKTEMDQMFDEIILSGDVMMTKPSPEIFKYAITKMAVEPNECLFIDDTMKNIESAQLVGMTGVLFGTFDQAKSDVEIILGE